MLYSIVEMAKENGLILDNYIVNVYERISQISMHCYPGTSNTSKSPRGFMGEYDMPIRWFLREKYQQQMSTPFVMAIGLLAVSALLYNLLN